jgi:hypothetical protein
MMRIMPLIPPADQPALAHILISLASDTPNTPAPDRFPRAEIRREAITQVATALLTDSESLRYFIERLDGMD